MIISRRTALGLMPLMPSAMRALTQTAAAPTRLRRLITGGPNYLIDTDGRVMAWIAGPLNVKGTLLGFTDDRVVTPFLAQEVPALRGATRIACGASSYAVMADGRVLAWGENWNGLLGNTPLSELEATSAPHPPVPTPTSTLPMPRVVDVASGEKHVLALTADGTVFAWGNGQAGQLGIGDMPTAYIPYPIQVPGLTNVTAIAAGGEYSLALLKDGTVRAWGNNRYGQLGDGSVETRTRPVEVRGITSAIAIASGGTFSAALLTDGTVMTWGWGSGGLGRPGFKSGGSYPLAAAVPDVVGMTAIACGAQHMLALARNGRVIAWGTENVYRPVGHPAIAATQPAAVPLITNARAVSAGALSSQALLDDGSFMVWGALPSLAFRVDGADGSGSRFPIPMVVKGLTS